MRMLTLVLMALVPGAIAAAAAGPAGLPGRIDEGRLETTIRRDVQLSYLLFLPDGYGRDDTRWPMIFYLHGAMGRGHDFEKLAWYPLPRMLREPGRAIPFVVLIPQCPPEHNWLDDDQLVALLDTVVATHAIDEDRVYLVGYSMGGMGAWHLAAAHPERFAAIAPMAGLANLQWAPRLGDVPVWAFHGAKDRRIPPSETADMVEALRALGAEVRFSLDPERGHSPPGDEAHMELFDWFLRHRRKN